MATGPIVGVDPLDRPMWQRLGMVPAVALAAALCALAGIAASAALANLSARDRPSFAAELWPANGFALANASSALIAKANTGANGGASKVQSLTVPQAARELALRAIRAEPTSAQALRNLALYHGAAGDDARAAKLMRLAVRLTARDTPANMWLVEDYLRRGDLPRAAALIDATLRTDTGAAALLLPQLALLLDQPGAEAMLFDLLQVSPAWGHDFWTAALQSKAAPEAAASLRILLHRRGAALARGHDARLIEQLIDAQAFAAAFALHAEAASSAVPIAPIDWRLGDAAGLAVSRKAAGQLAVSALAGSGGVVAQRLAVLPRGRYVLRIESNAAPGQLSARIVCAHRQGERTLALTPVLGRPFDQATQCSHAWLSLILAPADADRSLTVSDGGLGRIGDIP